MSVETVRPDTDRRAERTGRREEDHATRGDDAGAGEGRGALPVRSTDQSMACLPVRSTDQSKARLPVRSTDHGTALPPVRRPAETPEPGSLSRRALTLQAEVVQTRDEVLTARAEALVVRARILEAAGESVADLTDAAVSRDRIGVIVTAARPGTARTPAGATRCADSSTPAPCAPTSAPSRASPSSRSCCGASAPASSWTGCAGSTAPPCWRRSRSAC